MIAEVDRLVLAVLELDTCNLDHGADTPCVCDNHAWQSDGNDHEAGCQELRDALAPFRGARLPDARFSDCGAKPLGGQGQGDVDGA